MATLLILFNLLIPAAFAQTGWSESCLPADDLHHYVQTKLRAEVTDTTAGTIEIYYRLLRPFDKSKPTVLVIAGGPGGDSSIIDGFSSTRLEDEVNIVGFDHRGLGCTRVLSKVTTLENEQGLFGMSRASDDIEAIRKDLLGANGQWFVYGVSYGTMLGQEYVTRFPLAVRGIILDSALDSTQAIDIGRKQYLPLFVRNDATTSQAYDKIIARYPDLKFPILRSIRSMTYSYFGRVNSIPQYFSELLKANTRADAVQLIESHSDISAPLIGMTRQILCEEIWDYSTDQSANQYYWKAMADDCAPFAKYRHSLDFRQALPNLTLPMMIWGGRFDPVTPIQSMRGMKSLIPGSILWENPESGHGLISENPQCAIELASQFFNQASNRDLQKIMARQDCQTVPHLQSPLMKKFKTYIGPQVVIF